MNKCAFIHPENYIITPTTITFKGCKNRYGEDFASGMEHPTKNNVVIPDGFEQWYQPLNEDISYPQSFFNKYFDGERPYYNFYSQYHIRNLRDGCYEYHGYLISKPQYYDTLFKHNLQTLMVIYIRGYQGYRTVVVDNDPYSPTYHELYVKHYSDIKEVINQSQTTNT